ncbi:hypothetical protein F0562_016185 [Nyssa sinensis]|uniref:DUF6821 domain-containing protein n=1 Tax=Nyssa sinensis TaxID=561372 RepID=A0A5J4ZPQ4_9ASTE|nr:hypothetical protein F0562_016185 [Nyssa sinensis]
MDLEEEWELVPDGRFLEIHDDGGKQIFSRKYRTHQKTLFKTNYFISPSPNSQKFAQPSENPRVPKQIVPVPIQLEPTIGKVVKEIRKVPIEINIAPSVITENIKAPNTGAADADQDMVSQVFFKKMKENEFVDMKMDSPRSGSRGIMPQIDAGTFQFEDKSEAYKGEGGVEAMESKNCTRKMKVEKEMESEKGNLDSEIKEEVTWEENNGGLNIWKWSLTGIGAICSFGVAAATICIIIFGSSQRNKQHQQNQKLRFQIYTDDKRIKQVVHQATKLNEAILGVRGVPLARAHSYIRWVFHKGFCYSFLCSSTDLEDMEKEEKNQKACMRPETDFFFLQWGNKKRVRCVRVKDPGISDQYNGGRIRRKITSLFVTASEKETFPLQSTRLARNSSEVATLRSENRRSSSASPEKEDRFYTTRGSVMGSDENGKVSADGGGDDENRGLVWPKLYITLSSKEKEEDFMAMKGCKLPHRPKKRAKFIQRSLLLVSPGAWLSDMCHERYEVREKKSSKKRPRGGLKAMRSIESDSE